MKIVFIVLSLSLLFSCSSQERNTVVQPDKKNDSKSVVKVDAPKELKTGWNDNDTYTVRAVADNITKAKDRAKFQVLKDIVSIRMRNQSKYTDIEKINREFEEPFKRATVISQRDVPEGIEIYYQLRDNGLKMKFEKKD